MKKLVVIVAFSLLVASQASAANSVTMSLASTGVQGGTLWGSKTTAGATGQIPSVGTFLIGKTSTGVGLAMLTGAVGYSIITQHKSGNRGFGASYDSTAIYYYDRTAAQIGTPYLTGAPAASDSTLFTGDTNWTSM